MRAREGGWHAEVFGEDGSVQVGAEPAQQLAHLRHELEEPRRFACVSRARLSQIDVDDAGHPAGSRLITTTRVERNTASEIECVTKTTVEPICCQI